MSERTQRREHGRLPDSGRRLVHLRVERAEDLTLPLPLPSPRSIVWLVWDCESEPVEPLVRTAKLLFAAGAVYVCAWGRGSSRMHDVLTEVIVGDGDVDLERAPHATWQEHASLDETLWFAMTCAEPDDDLAPGCETLLVLEVGGEPARTAAIERALADPEEHIERVLADGS
jgi:hypothetical protein